MGKTGGIIGIIAGIFGIVAAVATLFIGGIGSAFDAEGAKTAVGLGWGGVLFSFLAIVFGAVAIARPKGAGIGLIIVSILGAIFGGTLVAICMALSLIGGIVAVVGARNTKTTTITVIDSATLAGDRPKRKMVWVWGLAGAAVLVVGLMAIFGQGAAQSKADPLVELASAQPSALRPEGELAELFAIGSKNTDLQRENKLKEIKGQIVQWQLPVYEISRSGDGYKVQTKMSVRAGMFEQNLLGTFVHITPRNDAERQEIEALRTGDVIQFKGKIAGSRMRSLEVRPAILASKSSPEIQPALSQHSIPTPVQSTSVLALVGGSPEEALEKIDLKEKFKVVLGENLESFRERIGVSSPIRQEGEWLVGEGAMPHLFSIEEAAFAINSKNSEIFAVMLVGGKEIKYFGTDNTFNLPPPLLTWVKDHGGN